MMFTKVGCDVDFSGCINGTDGHEEGFSDGRDEGLFVGPVIGMWDGCAVGM